MFIDFNEFTKNTESVMKEVCSFVGADPSLYKHRPLPPGMKVPLTSLPATSAICRVACRILQRILQLLLCQHALSVQVPHVMSTHVKSTIRATEDVCSQSKQEL